MRDFPRESSISTQPPPSPSLSLSLSSFLPWPFSRHPNASHQSASGNSAASPHVVASYVRFIAPLGTRRGVAISRSRSFSRSHFAIPPARMCRERARAVPHTFPLALAIWRTGAILVAYARRRPTAGIIVTTRVASCSRFSSLPPPSPPHSRARLSSRFVPRRSSPPLSLSLSLSLCMSLVLASFPDSSQSRAHAGVATETRTLVNRGKNSG